MRGVGSQIRKVARYRYSGRVWVCSVKRHGISRGKRPMNAGKSGPAMARKLARGSRATIEPIAGAPRVPGQRPMCDGAVPSPNEVAFVMSGPWACMCREIVWLGSILFSLIATGRRIRLPRHSVDYTRKLHVPGAHDRVLAPTWVSKDVQQCPSEPTNSQACPIEPRADRSPGAAYLMPAALMSFSFAVISSATRLSNSAGVIGSGSTASCVSLARVVGDCSAFTAAA